MAQQILKKVPEIPVIVPMCIYHKIDETTNEYLSYIGNPSLTKTKDGKTQFTCTRHDIGNPYKDWTLKAVFYAVNPIFRPIPSYMSLVCATPNSGFPNNTISVQPQYDPYNVENTCVNFITWLEPTPYTSPLFIYQMNEGVFVTFDENLEWADKKILTLYVLTSQPTKNTIFLNKNHSWFSKGENIPNFKFRQYLGRCSPDPEGIDLLKCIMKNAVGLIEPQSLLDYIDSLNQQDQKNKITPISITQNMGTIAISAILSLFLISLLFIIWKGLFQY